MKPGKPTLIIFAVVVLLAALTAGVMAIDEPGVRSSAGAVLIILAGAAAVVTRQVCEPEQRKGAPMSVKRRTGISQERPVDILPALTDGDSQPLLTQGSLGWLTRPVAGACTSDPPVSPGW